MENAQPHFLDRQHQRQLLECLRDKFPREHAWRFESREAVASTWAALCYLQGHGLVEAKRPSAYLVGQPVVLRASITSKGIDFLADDGGLGAILGVQVVRLHDDTIRSLIEARIQASDADPTAKAALIEQIRRTPANMLGHVVERALDASLRIAPDAMRVIAQALSG